MKSSSGEKQKTTHNYFTIFTSLYTCSNFKHVCAAPTSIIISFYHVYNHSYNFCLNWLIQYKAAFLTAPSLLYMLQLQKINVSNSFLNVSDCFWKSAERELQAVGPKLQSRDHTGRSIVDIVGQRFPMIVEIGWHVEIEQEAGNGQWWTCKGANNIWKGEVPGAYHVAVDQARLVTEGGQSSMFDRLMEMGLKRFI